jgi:hypothetical protein
MAWVIAALCDGRYRWTAIRRRRPADDEPVGRLGQMGSADKCRNADGEIAQPYGPTGPAAVVL